MKLNGLLQRVKNLEKRMLPAARVDVFRWLAVESTVPMPGPDGKRSGMRFGIIKLPKGEPLPEGLREIAPRRTPAKTDAAPV